MRIAVIGLGSIGRRHARNFATLGCTVRTIDAADDHGCAYDEALADLLEDCDGAVIATPPESHVELAWKALAADCHLMLEKPVALELNDLGHLFSAYRQKQLAVLVAYPWRYEPSMQRAKAQLDSIGRIRRWSCWYSYDTGNATALRMGPLFDCSHAIDFLRWMLGEPTSLYATFSNPLTVNLHMRFGQSPYLGHIVGSAVLSLEEPLHCAWTIEGDDGAVTWNRAHDVTGDINEMYLAEAEHFLACIRGEAKPLTDGWDGRLTLMVCDAALRSAKENRWIAR